MNIYYLSDNKLGGKYSLPPKHVYFLGGFYTELSKSHSHFVLRLFNFDFLTSSFEINYIFVT